MAVLNVAITKAKTTMAVDTDKIPEDVYAEALLLGLKVLLNRGASKVTASTYTNEEERKAAAFAVAEKQMELVNTSKIKFTGGKKKSGTSGAVMTEARRLAKALVKDEIKRQGGKISHYEASEITKAANAFLETEEGGKLVEQAKANLAEREKVSIGKTIDLGGLIAESPELVAKAEAKKKAKPLSAKQAGMVAKRSKGEGRAATN